jgi:hypothetical protein
MVTPLISDGINYVHVHDNGLTGNKYIQGMTILMSGLACPVVRRLSQKLFRPPLTLGIVACIFTIAGETEIIEFNITVSCCRGR